MTMLGLRAADPGICGICARRALAIGQWDQRAKKIMWLCGAPECVEASQGLTAMAKKKLDMIEERAVGEAAKACALPIVELVLEVLWTAGVRDMSQIDAGKIDEAAAEIALSSGPLSKFLPAYGAKIIELLKAGEPPF